MSSEVILRQAIQGLLNDYNTEGCPDPNCSICLKSKAAKKFAEDALKGINIVEQYVMIYGEQHREYITSTVKYIIDKDYFRQKKWDWDRYFEDLLNGNTN